MKVLQIYSSPVRLPKLSSVESGGSSAVSRIPTRRQPNPEKVKSFTISVPPPEGEVQEEPEEGSQAQVKSLSVTFTEESGGMEEKNVHVENSL